MTRTVSPRDAGGRFLRNLARTVPIAPCARVTRPHTTRKLVPFLAVLAL